MASFSSSSSNNDDPQLQLKLHQLNQARKKRQILEQTLVGTPAEEEFLAKKLKELNAENEALGLNNHRLRNEKHVLDSDEFKHWWSEITKLVSARAEMNHNHNHHEKEEHIPAKTLHHLQSKLHQLNHQISSLSLLESKKNSDDHRAEESNTKLTATTTDEDSSLLSSSSSSSSYNPSFSKYYSPLLKETSNLLREAFSLSQTLKHESNTAGPLAQLEEKHRQLQIAIDETKRKMHRVSLDAEKEERTILIRRYRSEIPQLKQELATRPKAEDVPETKQRMISQIEMLSLELSEVLEDMQVFEKREELEAELEKLMCEVDGIDKVTAGNDHGRDPQAIKNKNNNTQSREALHVEVASLQEQFAGLIDFSAEQKNTIQQWTKIELPRHQDFVARLEEERNQLRMELGKGFDSSTSSSSDVENEGVEEEGSKKIMDQNITNHQDNKEEPRHQEQSTAHQQKEGAIETTTPSPLLSATTSASSSSLPKRTIEVIHFDVNANEQTAIETTSAPTKRWQKSARFLSDSSSEALVANRYNRKQSNGDITNKDVTLNTPSSTSSSNLLYRALNSLSEFYHAPLVDYSSTIDRETGHRKDDRTEAASLTVRMLSRLSFLMFGEESWVEKGRRKDVAVDVAPGEKTEDVLSE